MKSQTKENPHFPIFDVYYQMALLKECAHFLSCRPLIRKPVAPYFCKYNYRLSLKKKIAITTLGIELKS
jgi:hypothetical protein